MGRILAIDYGQKRVGLAVTDTQQIIATSLTTVETNTVLAYLTEYAKKEKIESFVIGIPKQMNNTPSESMKYIQAFLPKLQKAFPEIPIFAADERFTSKIAFQTMLDGGLKKKDRQNKATVDTVSASLILQSFLEMKSNGIKLTQLK